MNPDSQPLPLAGERQLLLALLAVHLRLVPAEGLLTVLTRWGQDRSQPLGEQLHQAGLLGAPECAALETLCGRYLEGYDNNILLGLASLNLPADLRNTLAELGLLQASATVATSPPPDGWNCLTLPESDSAGGIGNRGEAVRFERQRHHASGGLGSVWVAYDRELKREVALKEIRADHAAAGAALTRFVLEAEITGGLEHPGVVPVYALGRYPDGRPYYAMRFIEGSSLRDAIAHFHTATGQSASQRSLELRQLLRRLVDVCNAIDYAHSRGVLHRDLKPGNIMLGKYGETLVVDWGMAKRLGTPELPLSETEEQEPKLGTALTLTGVALGTPAYMSPEQAAGRISELTPASDVYSLGATLYCLLTGRPPLIDRLPAEMLRKAQIGDFPRPRELSRAIAPALEAICLKAMELRPQHRYASARALADDVERWLADEPVDALPEGPIWKLRRWRRRHRTLTWTAFLVGLIVLLLLPIGWLGMQRQQQKQRVASYVENLPKVSPDLVELILDELALHGNEARPLLRRRWQDPGLTERERRRVGLALAGEDEEVRRELVHLARTAEDPGEVLLVQRVLGPYREELAPHLWEQVEGESPAEERFRLLVLLAAFDPDSPRWGRHVEAVTDHLLADNPLLVGQWVPALAPLRSRLRQPLARHFRTSSDAERRRLVATILADYASDQPEFVADLLADADDRQHALLWPLTRTHPDRMAAIWQQELTRRPAPTPWPNDSRSSAPVPGMTLTMIERADGIVADHFALWQRLPLHQLETVSEALSSAGYRPLRLRPYRQSEVLLVAAVWTRDGKPGGWRGGLSEEDAERLVEELRTAGETPCDLAVYHDVEVRYLMTWTKAEPGLNEVRLLHGQFSAKRIERWLSEDYRPHGHAVLCDDGHWHAGVWVRHQERPAGATVWPGLTAAEYESAQTPSNLQSDLCLCSTGQEPRFAAVWNRDQALESRSLHGLSPEAQRRSWEELASDGWRPAAVSVCALADGTLTTGSVWHRPLISEAEQDHLARRQAAAAVGLLRLGRPEAVWERLAPSSDPRCRTYLIHRLRSLGVSWETLAAELKGEPSRRQGLLLALGTYPTERVSAALLEQVKEWHSSDPDRGVHGATEWLLRRWGQDELLAQAQKQHAGQPPPPGRQWYVNGQGQTMVLLAAATFTMGSPANEAGRLSSNEPLHSVRLARPFALASMEVTVAQFQRFRPWHNYQRRVSPHADGPIIMITWYEAAEYCNWLSEQEKIPPTQWCYEPNAAGKYEPGMKLASDYLARTGYRLPTEAEWEYACRAGTTSPWHHGGSEALLKEYAWYAQMTGNAGVARVGRRMPNDWGLFDMHGNVVEWCQEPTLSYQWPYLGGVWQDRERGPEVDDRQTRLLRGGGFNYLAPYVRSARHFGTNPSNHQDSSGLRVARTMPH